MCRCLSCCADNHGVMMHGCHAVQAGLLMMAVAAGLVDLQSCIPQVLDAATGNAEARLMWLTVLLGPGAFESCSASPASAGLAAELHLLQRQLPLQLMWDQLRPLLEVRQLPLSQLATIQAAEPSRCSSLPATEALDSSAGAHDLIKGPLTRVSVCNCGLRERSARTPQPQGLAVEQQPWHWQGMAPCRWRCSANRSGCNKGSLASGACPVAGLVSSLCESLPSSRAHAPPSC